MTRVAAPVRAHVRYLIRRDMTEVLAIENISRQEPWSEEDFLRPLRREHVHGYVAEIGEAVVGFAIYDPRPNNVLLLNLAVHPEWRRCGVGRGLIERQITRLTDRRPAITCTVNESALDAQLFFREMGFKCETIAHNFFDDEDGYVFAYRLGAK